MQNLFAQIPDDLAEEFVQTLLSTPNLRIERIVSQGHASPPGFWYGQEQNEFVAVLAGAARLQFEDELVELKAGDSLNIPAHRRHRVEWTTSDEPTIWLAVFYG
jgi:cupin 2 domain-containing protein